MPRIRINPKISVSVVFVAVMFMNIMDITIVNVALPSIGRQFHESTTALDSVVVAFLVSLAVVIPAAGWLGDRVGMKRVFLFATALFTLASVLCGLAGSLDELVVFRVFQGVGGGLMTPVGMAMLYRTFPPAERVRASSILTVPTAVAPATGPVLGGLLVTALSWRWVFFVNLPIGLLAVLFGLVFLDEHRERVSGRFDLAGLVLSASGFALLMFGVSDGSERGWGSPAIAGSLVAGAVLVAALVAVELRRPDPLLKVRLFANRLFRSASGTMFFGVAAFLGVLFVVPLFFQLALGLSALQSGLNTFPEALGVMVGAQTASRLLYPRFGPRRLMAVALVGVAVSMSLMTQIGFGTSLWWMRLLMFLMGLSMSQVFISSQAASFASMSHAEMSHASSLYNSQRQLGSALGVAILSTVLAAIGTVHQVDGHSTPDLTAYHAAFVVAAAIALIGSVTALAVPDADAAATMVPRRRTRRPEGEPGGGPAGEPELEPAG